jgi:hypothetical protein
MVTGLTFTPPLLVFLAWYSTSVENSWLDRFWEVGRVFMMKWGRKINFPKKDLDVQKHGLCNPTNNIMNMTSIYLVRKFQCCRLNKLQEVLSERWDLFSPPYLQDLGFAQFGL